MTRGNEVIPPMGQVAVFRGLVARPPVKEEEEQLRNLAKARNVPMDWAVRARIIELSWAGFQVLEIARRVERKPRTVRVWIHRFNSDGLTGLADRARPGRPRLH